jgi:hypothetical protein
VEVTGGSSNCTSTGNSNMDKIQATRAEIADDMEMATDLCN